MDGNGNPSLPYSIQYDLAKDSLVTVLIKDSNGNVVRNFDNATNTPQFNETIKTNVLTWDGLGNDQRPVPLAVYTVQIDAREPSPGTDVAITRTRTVAIQSLASLGTSPNETFAANTFVYPNPVRNGQATFQFLAVRNNATISMKIYNLAGDLVRDESFPNLATGNLVTFNWDATNESGEKVGRGLYYYVVREEDQEGTLQTIKKFAVIP
jgi:flagellar hook assembly protein FlgD